jgi:hypothetical protein
LTASDPVTRGHLAGRTALVTGAGNGLEAAATGTSYAKAEEAFVSRAALHRLVEESEVAAAVLAMPQMPGLGGADIDLSAGMVAPA